MKSVLTLVSSKNPPVFETPMIIEHDKEPIIGYPLLFSCDRYAHCNTSDIKEIQWDSERSIKRLTTRNSVYQLQHIFEAGE